MNWSWSWILLLIGAGVAIGLLVLRETRAPEPDLRPARTGDPNKVAIQPIDFDGLEREVKSHRGSVVLVDFWATWCGPCRKEFPKLVAMHERYSERGLVVVSVSLEKDPEAHRERALSFLKGQLATFPNFIWTDRTTRGQNGLEEKFGYPGGIPYGALFARNGERVLPPDGQFFATLELLAAIEGELEKKH